MPSRQACSRSPATVSCPLPGASNPPFDVTEKGQDTDIQNRIEFGSGSKALLSLTLGRWKAVLCRPRRSSWQSLQPCPSLSCRKVHHLAALQASEGRGCRLSGSCFAVLAWNCAVPPCLRRRCWQIGSPFRYLQDLARVLPGAETPQHHLYHCPSLQPNATV